MHISAGVALLMREKKVREFYFNLGSVFGKRPLNPTFSNSLIPR